MTASELYEIVKDVPEAAKPELVYQNWEWRCCNPEHCTWNDQVSVDLTEAAFVGSMVAHLGYVEVERYQTTTNDPAPTFCVRYGLGCVTQFFPTLIEALAAACKDSKENAS